MMIQHPSPVGVFISFLGDGLEKKSWKKSSQVVSGCSVRTQSCIMRPLPKQYATTYCTLFVSCSGFKSKAQIWWKCYDVDL